MKITVLGSYGPYPPAGGCCSGYLLEYKGFYLLLECGNGVLSRLQFHLEPHRLSAVLLSHLHSDHISDLFILRYSLLFAMQLGLRNEPLPLYAPSEPHAEFDRLPYKNVYRAEEIQTGQPLQIGPFTCHFKPVQHSITSLGLAVEVEGKKQLAFSGDTEYCPELEEVARNSAIFLCESSYLEEEIEQGASNHMSAKQAGLAACNAGADRLLLTHFRPETDKDRLLKEAREMFSRTDLAEENETYTLF